MPQSHHHPGDDAKHGHHSAGQHESHANHHGPYWRRMHRDWRIWVGVTLMLIAMGIYIVTENLSLRPAGAPPVKAPGAP